MELNVFQAVLNGRIDRSGGGVVTVQGVTPEGRKTATITTPSIATNASWSGTIVLGKAYRLYAISTSQACRTRLYTTASALAGDASRPIGTDPVDGSGVLFEFVSDSTLLSSNLSPLVDGYSGDSPAVDNINIAVTNLTTTNPITITFTYLKTEF